MDINNVVMSGRVGQAPELKQAGSTSYASFSIAVQGMKKEDVTWVNVKIWGKSADYLVKNLKKGKRCQVVGRLVINDHDGKKYVSVEGNLCNIIDFAESTTPSTPSNNEGNSSKSEGSGATSIEDLVS